jgi:hypothetical protein
MYTVFIRHWRSASDPKIELTIENDQLRFVQNGQDILEYDILSVTDEECKPVDFLPSYHQWIRNSRRLCNQIAGCSLDDAGDYDARQSYECGMTPLQFVAEHLDNAGFPFPQQFDPDGDEKEQLLVLATFSKKQTLEEVNIDRAVSQEEDRIERGRDG